MPYNNSRQAIIDNRRRQVAILRLRGMTQREIIATLERQGVVNPATGQPWSLGIINIDLKALDAEWRAEAAKAIDEHKARQLAELNEVRRAAWAAKDLVTVLRVLKQEADILGTAAAIKVHWQDTLPDGYDANEVLRQFTAMMMLAAKDDSAD